MILVILFWIYVYVWDFFFNICKEATVCDGTKSYLEHAVQKGNECSISKHFLYLRLWKSNFLSVNCSNSMQTILIHFLDIFRLIVIMHVWICFQTMFCNFAIVSDISADCDLPSSSLSYPSRFTNYCKTG